MFLSFLEVECREPVPSPPLVIFPNLIHALLLVILPLTSSSFYFYFPLVLISPQCLFYPTVLYTLLKLLQILLQKGQSYVNEHVNELKPLVLIHLVPVF